MDILLAGNVGGRGGGGGRGEGGGYTERCLMVAVPWHSHVVVWFVDEWTSPRGEYGASGGAG